MSSCLPATTAEEYYEGIDFGADGETLEEDPPPLSLT